MKQLLICAVIICTCACTKTINTVQIITKDSLIATNTTVIKDSIIIRDSLITDSPILRTCTLTGSDTISFAQNQNIIYQNYAGTASRVLIWLNCNNAKVGTIVNLYVWLRTGVTVQLFSTCYGQLYPLNTPANPTAIEWYFNIVYMGNNNGENIYNVTTYTY